MFLCHLVKLLSYLSERLTSAFPKMIGASYITLFCGEEVDEDGQAKAAEIIKAAVPSAEVVVINGGQPIYSYVISVEK